jgi:hypothetical protein
MLRDQSRLFQRRDLTTVLDPGLTASDWVRLLNQRVYLFADVQAKDLLLEKYRRLDGAQEVVVFSPARLYETAAARMELTIQNSGSIARRTGPQKSASTFIPLVHFPDKRMPSEITIRDGLTDLSAVVEVRRVYADGRRESLYHSVR